MDTVKKRIFGSDRQTEQTRSNIEQKSTSSGTRDKGNDKLQDLYKLAKKIGGVLNDYTTEGLEEVNRDFHSMGIYDSNSQGLTDKQKEENQQIEIKNITSAMLHIDDLEKLYAKVLATLKCIEKAKNISKQTKKTMDDLLSSAKSFDNISKRLAEGIPHDDKIKGKFGSSVQKLFPDSLENFRADYEVHQKNTQKIISNQIEITSQRLGKQQQVLKEAEDLYAKAEELYRDPDKAKERIEAALKRKGSCSTT